MRVSPVGWLFDDLETTERYAEVSARVTHNHPEGIKGASSVAAAIFLARTANNKGAIKKYVAEKYYYDLDRTLDEIRPGYKFDVSCQGSVPEAIIAFLESGSFEDSLRKAVSIGGDSDTIAAITGSIAEAFWGIPDDIAQKSRKRLDKRLLSVIERWEIFLSGRKTER
jgi:ADP-ribosylglycohydrolase